jgi:hypothetical protein
MEMGKARPVENRDVGRALVIGAIGSVPVIGPFIGALLDVYIPEQRARRTAEFLDALAADVNDLDFEVDHEFVRQDEFQGVLEETLERVASRRAEGMRSYYAAAVANSMLPTRPDEHARFRMLDLLAQLRPNHMALLARIAEGGKPIVAGPDVLTVGQAAVAAITNLGAEGTDDVMADLAHLERLGLTRPIPGAAIIIASNVRNLLTAQGMAFVDFVRRPAAVAPPPA